MRHSAPILGFESPEPVQFPQGWLKITQKPIVGRLSIAMANFGPSLADLLWGPVPEGEGDEPLPGIDLAHPAAPGLFQLGLTSPPDDGIIIKQRGHDAAPLSISRSPGLSPRAFLFLASFHSFVSGFGHTSDIQG
ncbi:hypothetical protein ES708_31798 [subsurface metagenome]